MLVYFFLVKYRKKLYTLAFIRHKAYQILLWLFENKAFQISFQRTQSIWNITLAFIEHSPSNILHKLRTQNKLYALTKWLFKHVNVLHVPPSFSWWKHAICVFGSVQPSLLWAVCMTYSPSCWPHFPHIFKS